MSPQQILLTASSAGDLIKENVEALSSCLRGSEPWLDPDDPVCSLCGNLTTVVFRGKGSVHPLEHESYVTPTFDPGTFKQHCSFAADNGDGSTLARPIHRPKFSPEASTPCRRRALKAFESRRSTPRRLTRSTTTDPRGLRTLMFES